MLFSDKDGRMLDEAAKREMMKDERRAGLYMVLAVAICTPPAVTLILLGLKWVGVLG